MKHSSRLAVAVALVAGCTVVGAGALVGRSVLAQPASSSARAVPALPPDPVDAPTLAAVTIPTDRSDPPKRTDWTEATLVAVTARGARGRKCTAHLLREYLRVRCPMAMAGVRQFAGSIEDVEVWVTPKGPDASGFVNLFAPPNGGDVVVPLRKGQSYLFQFFEVAEGYEGFGVADGALVDISWPMSRSAPTVVVR